jgi:hypothetical protein
MNRQKLVLFLLLLVLAGSIAFSVLHSPKQQRAAAPKYAPGAVAQVTAGKAATLPKPGADDSKLHLEILNRELPRFNGYRRNIFSPVFREEVKVPPFKPLPPPPRPVKMPPPQPLPANALPPAPPSPEQIADSELAKFTFLGYLEKNGEKTVFLSSNHEIFLAKKGSNLGPRFQVTGLSNDAITIRSVTGGREMVIPLVENRALSTRRTQ